MEQYRCDENLRLTAFNCCNPSCVMPDPQQMRQVVCAVTCLQDWHYVSRYSRVRRECLRHHERYSILQMKLFVLLAHC